MITRASGWMRVTARSVLLTFTTSMLACGGAPSESPATTTTMVEETPTTSVPATFPPQPPPQPEAAAPPSTLPAEAPDQLSKEELRELVAPVALYPDVVLASLLPATTFPDQLRDAAQFVGQSEQVDDIPQDRGWDGSIIGLLQFPDVVRWLDGNPAWADQMGMAVTYQQGDVLGAIQDYRRVVADAGNLKTNQYQKVRVVPDQDILIEPARPDIVYVPSYDPALAVQPQPVVVQESPGVNPWIAFGGGAVVGALGAWALYSIFDDDDDHDNYYGGGYRGRRIRGYDNYYYARGRRPRAAAWNPRPRAYRARPPGWQRPQRLRYATPTPNAARRRAALRPPAAANALKAPTPASVQKQQRQENRQQKQVQQQQQRQENRQQKQVQQQQKQMQQQEKKQAQQQQQREKQQQRQENRQQKQGQQQENRQQKQVQQQQKQMQQQEKKQGQQQQQREKQQQRQENRQQQQGQRQENRQQKQTQRQDNRQQKQEQRQEKKGGGNGGNKKKKQQQNQ